MENGERFGRLEERMDNVEKAVTNFRNLDKNVTEFMATYRAQKEVLKDAVDKHNWRIMLVVALVGLVLAVLQLAIEWGHHRPSGTLLNPPKIFTPKTHGELYHAQVNPPQDAGIKRPDFQ